VAGEPRGVFREDQLDVGQRFRNPYERSKFEAERMIRERANGMPLQVLRPSIIVGDSRTGRTSSFNVLYGPLKAFARGRIPAIPARRSAPVDIVPVDYVADRTYELLTDGPDGTFHLVAGRNATTVGRLLELTGRYLKRKPPAVLPPGVYGRILHPWLRRKYAGLRSLEVYFPYFSMRVRFDDRGLGPGPPVERYFHRLVEFAQRAGWGRVPSAV
jgi:nucleoside-diphosphate-sugar epimerase